MPTAAAAAIDLLPFTAQPVFTLPDRWYARVPWLLLAIAAALVLLGHVGIARAEALDGSDGSFLARQRVWSVVAAAALVLAALPNYRVLCRFSFWIYAASLVLLLLVFLWPPINGAQRWLRFGPVSLQPSEFAKIACVLALARYLMYRESQRRLSGFLAPLLLAVVPSVLILREPDLGTALVFPPLVAAMLFAAGARLADLAKLALAGLLIAPLMWTQMSREQRSRVTALFEQPPPGVRPSDDAYHLYQSKQVMALGGVWGSWLTGDATDDQAAYRLPESHSDFVFSVLGERLGLLGNAGVLLLYVLLLWQALAIAVASREPFGRLVACGIAILFGVQALINTGMTVGLLPITGMSLPLVSYGGSGLVAHAIALGLLVNIAMRPGFELAKEPFRFQRELC